MFDHQIDQGDLDPYTIKTVRDLIIAQKFKPKKK